MSQTADIPDAVVDVSLYIGTRQVHILTFWPVIPRRIGRGRVTLAAVGRSQAVKRIIGKRPVELVRPEQRFGDAAGSRAVCDRGDVAGQVIAITEFLERLACWMISDVLWL